MVTLMMMAAASSIAFGSSGSQPLCDRGAAEPRAYHARGYGMVAEVFPPRSRNNDSDSPTVYMYRMSYPGPRWESNAELAWSAPLPHEEFPLAAVVSPEGHLVTLDDHSVAGQGHDRAVVLFDSRGKRLNDFAISDLFASSELADLEISDCGFHWRDGARFFFVMGEAPRFYVLLRDQRVLEFNLESGRLQGGQPDSFPDLQGVLARQFANEEVQVWSISLRFASLTDRAG